MAVRSSVIGHELILPCMILIHTWATRLALRVEPGGHFSSVLGRDHVSNALTSHTFTRLRALHLAAAVAAVLALAACGDKAPSPTPAATSAVAPSAAPAPASAPPAEPAPAPQPRGEAAASAKMNVYITCFNRADKRAHDAMNRYGQWVKDMKTGPTGKERLVYGVYTVSEHDVKLCSEPLLKAADSSPAMAELDQAAKAYAGALQPWAASLAEADQYYTREDYKDDAFAKGKAMHANLVTHYEAFETASRAYNQALDRENDKLQAARLAAVEQAEGRQFNYWHLATMISAKQLIEVLDGEFALDEASAKLQAFEEASQGLNAFVAEQGDGQAPMVWSSFKSRTEALVVSAKQRIRRVRDKVAYTSFEQSNLSSNAGWMVEGSPDRVIRSYNELIQASGNLR